MKRDANIELFRILLMLGICWLHCCQQGGGFAETMNIYYLMRPCVVGFVFISGWFGIRPGWKKFARIIVLGATCAFLSVIIRNLSGGWSNPGGLVKDSLFSLITGYWFLWAYLGLMVLAPILDAAIAGDEKTVNRLVLPLFCMVYGWSFSTHIPIVKDYIPISSGVTALSCLTMSATYVAARLIRTRGYDRYMHGWKFWLAVFWAVIASAVGFSHYDSPFALIVAVGGFQAVRKIKLPHALQKAIVFIAPSMFSVYLLHQAYRGFGFVGLGMKLAEPIAGGFALFETFTAAIIVWMSCSAIDILRRGGKFCVLHSFKRNP